MMRSVATSLSPLDAWIWAVGTTLEVGVFTLALYRGLYRRLPIFTTYIGLVVLWEALQWSTLQRMNPASGRYFYFYWISQAVLLTARGLVVAELCYRVVRPYRGVWLLARLLLLLTAATLLVFAAMESAGTAVYLDRFIPATERGLEFAVVGSLLALLGICRYYGLELDLITRAVALGLSLYSILTIVNNSMIFESILPHFWLWTVLRRFSYQGALLVWVWPLLQPLAEREPLPVMASAGMYQELAPELSERMRELNNRLQQFLQR